METEIQSIIKSKTIDYSNELLENFWQQKLNISENQNHKSEIVKIIESAQEGIVCIQTETLTDKGLIKQIFDIAQNLKVRFYILVNEYSHELDLLNERIASAKVVDLNKQPKDEIRFGASITVEVNDEKRPQKYQIVGVDEANIKDGKISFISPIAQLLINKKVGDEAVLKLGTRKRIFTVLSIDYL